MVRYFNITCEFCRSTLKSTSWSKHLKTQKHKFSAGNYEDETYNFPLLQNKDYISKLSRIDQPSVIKRDENGHIYTLKRNPAYEQLIRYNYNDLMEQWEKNFPGDVLTVRVETTNGTHFFEAGHHNVLENIIIPALFGKEVGLLHMGYDNQTGSDVYTTRISFYSALRDLNREKDRYIRELNESLLDKDPSAIKVETRGRLRQEINRIDRRISGVNQRSRGSFFPYCIKQKVIEVLDSKDVIELRECQIYSEENYNQLTSKLSISANDVLNTLDDLKWMGNIGKPCLEHSLKRLGINVQHLIERDIINHFDETERKKDDIVKFSNEMSGFNRDINIIVKRSTQHFAYTLYKGQKAFKVNSLKNIDWEDGVLILKENHFFTVFSRHIFDLVNELLDNKDEFLLPVNSEHQSNIKHVNFVKNNNREITREDLKLSLSNFLNQESGKEEMIKKLQDLYKINYDHVYICDGECTVNEPFDDKGSFLHRSFAAGLARIDLENKRVDVKSYRQFVGLNCGFQILKYLSTIHSNSKRIIILFHNSKYDLTTMFSHQKTIGVPLKKDGNFYCSSYSLRKGQKIDILDSFKFLPFQLAVLGTKFKSAFHKKETIVYDKYTLIENAPDFAKKFSDVLDPSEEFQTVEKYYFDDGQIEIDSENEKFNSLYAERTKRMTEALNSGYLFEKDEVQYIKAFEMYEDYLKFDVLTLGEVMASFIKYCEEITNGIPLFRKMSTSGYFSGWAADCVLEVESLSGIADEFLNKSLQGGRVFCNEKIRGITMEAGTKDVFKTRIGNFENDILGNKNVIDFVSLYPSAIKEICDNEGFPKGFPVLIEDGDFNRVFSSGQYYVVKILITKVNREWDQGIIRTKESDKIRYGNNVPLEPVILCKTDLEEYIKYHEIDFEFIFGMYYPEGYCGKALGEKIDFLFEKRLEAKKLKNDALQETVKLGLNSIFGGHLLNISPVKNILVKSTELSSFIYNNKSTYISHEPSCKGYYSVKLYDNSVENKSKKIIGIEILARARCIVNRVLFLVQSMGFRTYYSDTDSLWIDSGIMPGLESKYEFVYGKKLVGKNLGELHPDAEIVYNDEKISAEIDKCLFLESKSYVANLIAKNPENDDFIYGQKTGFKGISKPAIINTSNFLSDKEEIRDRVFETIENTLLPGGVKFILNPSQLKKVAFEFTSRRDEDKNEIPCVISRPENSFFRNVKF